MDGQYILSMIFSYLPFVSNTLCLRLFGILLWKCATYKFTRKILMFRVKNIFYRLNCNILFVCWSPQFSFRLNTVMHTQQQYKNKKKMIWLRWNPITNSSWISMYCLKCTESVDWYKWHTFLQLMSHWWMWSVSAWIYYYLFHVMAHIELRNANRLNYNAVKRNKK